MKMSKRQFMKLGMGSMAGVILAPLLKPDSLLASPVVLPPDYLDSPVHAQWMKLSYNNGRESRQTRRCLGAALRNIGAIKGKGRGDAFANVFDLAVQRAFLRRRQGLTKPGSLMTLIQGLYNDTILREMGTPGGQVLFGTLLAVLRGRDGTAQGEQAHRSYLAYRDAALAHKDAYRKVQDPKELELIRRNRLMLRAQWQLQLSALTSAYAMRQRMLNQDFVVATNMMEGFDVYIAPILVSGPNLTIAHVPRGIEVRWDGPAQLLQGPTPLGPWSPVNQPSPALFDGKARQQYFRTVQTAKPRTQ